MENENIKNEKWTYLIKKHWIVFTIAIIAAIGAMIGAVWVFIWFIETSDIGLHGTATFDQWNLSWVVSFLLNIIYWELLLVGLPSALIFGIGGYFWWHGLSDEEKLECKKSDNIPKRHKARSSGIFNVIMFIAYCLYINSQGLYETSFGTLPYSYWVLAYLWTVLWMLLIVGIPVSIIGIIYFCFWRKNQILTN